MLIENLFEAIKQCKTLEEINAVWDQVHTNENYRFYMPNELDALDEALEKFKNPEPKPTSLYELIKLVAEVREKEARARA